MEREFTNKSWQYAVKKVDIISRSKSYVTRFRIDYYMFVSGKGSGKDLLKGFINNIIGLASEIRYIFVFQLGRSKKIDPNLIYIVHLSDSNSFLKTILPVCEMLLANNCVAIFLCPANHYSRLKSHLDPQIVASLYKYEQIQIYPNKVKVILHLFRALFLSLFDITWFILQPVKRSFSTSFSFGRHSFVHHYSDRFWKAYFNIDKKIFIAAEDQYLWEVALFDNIQGTQSLSFVFQHGKLSDAYYPTAAKQFCTYGVIDFNKMVKEFKAIPSEILVTGSPCFDKIYNHYQKHSIGSRAENLCITFFAQPFYRIVATSTANYLSALNWFYKLSANKHFSNYKFILKLHPHDLAAFYESRPSNIEIVHDNLLPLIEKSLFNLTVDSSSVFEAAFCGVPTIQTIPPGDLFGDESYTGISMKATTYNELEKLALRLLEDKVFYQDSIKKSRDALNLYFSNLGHSLDRIKDLLMVGNNKQHTELHS